MARTFQLVVLFSAVCFSSTIGEVAEAGGRSGWGWAKPLNKRMGAFYTSNKNANFSRSKSSSYYRQNQRRTHYPSHYRVQTQPAHRYVPAPITPGVTIHQDAVPTARPLPVPAAPISNQTIPLPAAPQQLAPSLTTQPKAIVPTPNVVVPKQVTAPSSLPHHSTTTEFWQ